VPRVLRVGWLLVGDERVASARIQGFAVHRDLLRRGIRSEILNAPGSFDTRLHWKAPRRWLEALVKRRHVLVFQKVESSRAVRLARLARRAGSRVVFLQSDLRPSPLYEVADRIVVCSSELARLLAPVLPFPPVVIEDPIDLPPDVCASARPASRGLRLVWVGSRSNFDALEILRGVLSRAEFSDFALETVSDHPEASVAWSREAALRAIRESDIGLLPCLDTPAARAKSSNRLTLMMGAGLPVIASPIPSYETIVEHGASGFLAVSEEEWAGALRALREPELRRRVGEAARSAVWRRFAPEVIGGQWAALLYETAGIPAA